MSNLHYSLWAIWPWLSVLPKLYFLTLSLVSIYTLFSATFIVVRLHSLAKKLPVEDADSIQGLVFVLHTRSANMRQLHGAMFYLFGFVFFMTLPAASFVSELSRTPTIMLILRNFLTDFAFAANVFLVFLVLHFVQWFVSGRVRAFGLRLNACASD